MTKILVANRGEIAVRVIRAIRELGLQSVAVYSDADESALHVQMADEAQHIGPAPAAKSYLNVEAILEAAKKSAADYLHPGYGFLAENADFVEACEEVGLNFVGPGASSIRRMGDKAVARAAAKEAAVPIVPGTVDPVEDLAEAKRQADEIGYPVMVKAAAGGGGRGIRVADNEEQLEKGLSVAQQEARSAFGSGAVYLEKLIENARHVEVQILGDGSRAIHLLERECSLQRRRQKILEEALSPALNDETRARMTQAAVKLTEAVQYKGAGTLEFLFNPESSDFYFIEMNTRIQVEHPVTEMVTGVDLVKAQLRIALGEGLSLEQDDISPRGWAIECRINAENPDKNFRPSPGTVRALHWPGGPGVRVDTALYPDYQIPPFYDSMIAKLVTHGATRDEALARMRRALSEVTIEGIDTTVPLFGRLLNLPEVKSGDYHINFLEGWLDEQT